MAMKVLFLFGIVSLVSCAAAQAPRFVVSYTVQMDGEREAVALIPFLVPSGEPAVFRPAGFEIGFEATEAGNAVLLETKFRSGEHMFEHAITVLPGEVAKFETGEATITVSAEPVAGDA